jgi:hypothetical protein
MLQSELIGQIQFQLAALVIIINTQFQKRDIQRTVVGKTYNSVIELTYDFSVDDPLGGPVVSVGDGKYYYAKGVGLIEAYFGFSFFGVSSSDTTRLLNYTIR